MMAARQQGGMVATPSRLWAGAVNAGPPCQPSCRATPSVSKLLSAARNGAGDSDGLVGLD